jgi:hypothetical protein
VGQRRRLEGKQTAWDHDTICAGVSGFVLSHAGWPSSCGRLNGGVRGTLASEKRSASRGAGVYGACGANVASSSMERLAGFHRRADEGAPAPGDDVREVVPRSRFSDRSSVSTNTEFGFAGASIGRAGADAAIAAARASPATSPRAMRISYRGQQRRAREVADRRCKRQTSP